MASDPVAEKSAFLRMYMSNHPDTLVAYAKWYGQVSEPITSAEMTAIDTKSMTLGCKMKDGKTKEVRVPIEPPMTGYDDVKPRLLEMKAIAQEGLGMIKTPKITSFQFPLSALQVIFIIHPVLAYFAYAPVNNPTLFVLPARMLATYLGPSVGYWIYWSMNVIHVFEAMYTWSLCRKHQTGFSVGIAYVSATLICGYHIWRDLRKRIQGARIDSVMKIE
ncbi:hypothetical protein BDP27DRAFT_1228302 [Rhodocollybia butyracea]|uniref:DUF2470 domain-containing protein n=1 Tax=Rhodocollybia butyracea TaxID=206335 RepID=A0A9P5PL84_9AGAR|nr:hypothetical protein BDP27DRAFT_1228302 [Rhodocollybia butyracea]